MSNAEKRSVATDALETLGTVPIPDNSGRDAIHLAVEPAVAGMALRAGERIKLFNGQAYTTTPDQAIGIVDPFVSGTIRTGTKFWLVVLPRTITSLRHVWSHPAFPEEVTPAGNNPLAFNPQQSMSMAWMKDYCRQISEEEGGKVTYDELMGAAKRYLQTGDYYYGPVTNEYNERWSGTPAFPTEFWDHYQNITGEIVPVKKQDSFFNCSC